MTLAPRLDLRQSQSLVMTPQLQQAIKLLALSNLEIEAFVAGELEKNPLLEAGGTDDFAPPADGVDRAAEQHDLRAETGDADQLIGQGLGAADSPLDVDYGAETFIDDGPGEIGRAHV